MVFNYNVAQLGGPFTQDPVVSLFTYLKNNWTQATGYSPPAASAIKFDSKFGLVTGFNNYVIVERMPATEEDQTVGKTRKRVYDNMIIQIYCQGSSAINNRWLMEMHIRSIIDANPTALRTNGIDEIGITTFQPILTDYEKDSDITDRAPANKGLWISRSRAKVELIYDLYAQ